MIKILFIMAVVMWVVALALPPILKYFREKKTHGKDKTKK